MLRSSDNSWENLHSPCTTLLSLVNIKEQFGALLQHEHFHLKLWKCYLSYPLVTARLSYCNSNINAPLSQVYTWMRTECECSMWKQSHCCYRGRQTVFGCATNVRRTAVYYPSTVGTSKGICIQYVYVWLIRCLGKCQTVYECTIQSASPLVCMHHSCPHFRYKPDFTLASLSLFCLWNEYWCLWSCLFRDYILLMRNRPWRYAM